MDVLKSEKIYRSSGGYVVEWLVPDLYLEALKSRSGR